MEKIELYTSKKKSFLHLLSCIAFVLLGIWLITEADNLTGWRTRNPLFTGAIGITAIMFSVLGIFVFIKRLIKSEIVLIIDPVGLIVNPKKSTSEYIKWKEIIGFEEIKIKSARILTIVVKNPDNWLVQETNIIRKRMMQFNIKNYMSPFNIAASSIDCNFNELKETLNKYHEKYKN